MSRWTEEFKAHPFQAEWEVLKTELSEVEVDDQTVMTSVQELARLKQVITYVDGIVQAAIPELTPKSVWDNFHQQVGPCLSRIRSYVGDRNIAQIREANVNADNLLTYVKPYLIAPAEAIAALKDASLTYGREIDDSLESFKNKSAESAADINAFATTSKTHLEDIEGKKSQVETYAYELLEGDEENPSIKDEIDEFVENIKKQNAVIEEYHQKLIDGVGDEESIQAQIEEAYGEITDTNEKIVELLDGVSQKTKDLQAFHVLVFGKPEEDGSIKSGLKFEIEKRKTEIDALTVTQKGRYDTLFKQIEGLLPGATSAGLASAYGNLKTTFTDPITNYTKIFYGAIGTLFVTSLIFLTQEIHVWPKAEIIWADTKDWDMLFKGLLFKLPLVGPVIWLALFAAARRNQYERLQQEYSHKEALASSYESYKTQLIALGKEGEELQKHLIESAINAISFNASSTLDKKHLEKLPIQELFDKLSLDELKKLLEFYKSKPSAKSDAKATE